MKNVIYKRYMAGALAAMTVFALAGCSSQSTTEETTDTAQQESQDLEYSKEPVETETEAESQIVPDPTPIAFDYSMLPEVVGVADVLNVSDYIATASYTAREDGCLTVTLDVENTTGAHIQTITYDANFDQEWLDMYLESYGQIARFLDVNFDGYADLVVQMEGAQVNQSYAVFLFHPNDNQFEQTNRYDAITNMRSASASQFILSTNYGAQGIPTYALYQIADDALLYLGRIEGSVDEESNIHYVEYMLGTLAEDGSVAFMETEVETVVQSSEEVDALWSVFGLIM